MGGVKGSQQLVCLSFPAQGLVSYLALCWRELWAPCLVPARFTFRLWEG